MESVCLQLTAIAVGGLDTATVLRVETPSPQRLTASVAFRELRLQLHGHVHIVPGPAVQHSKGPVDLNLTLATTLTDVAVAAGLTLHVDEAAFSRLALSQLRERACVARTLRFAELLPLNATVGAMGQWRVEGVSDSLDDLLTSVASSFNMLYGNAVEAMLPHLANGPLLELLNSSLASTLTDWASASCPPAPAPDPFPTPPAPPAPPLPEEPALPPGMIVWGESPLLRVLDQAGAELLGADGLWGVK